MARIIFLNPFASAEISGGIKTAHRHAELLGEMGFDALVYQPKGAPSWFETRARTLRMLKPAAGDILVFPETLNGPLAELAQAPSPARKIMFCQNQYYMAMNALAPARLFELGFSAFCCSSEAARGFLAGVLGIRDATIIPYHVDPTVFFPCEKAMQIALVPRKMPREAGLLRSIFRAKYPRFRAVPWQAIEGASERATADILGRSAIFVSLSYFESFGLVPVEAMASGCLVAGFDGYGGREYAAPANGFWFRPDALEELADAIAAILAGLESGDAHFDAMRKAGAETAARYNKERTRAVLCQFYGELI